MSYTPMMNNTISRGSYVPEYDNNAYKIPPPPQNYGQYSVPNLPPNQPLYSQSGTQSVALFSIPSDGTNSLYIDGVPNDTTEREVSRKCIISQTSSALSPASSVSASSKRQRPPADSFSSASWISRTCCSPPSP